MSRPTKLLLTTVLASLALGGGVAQARPTVGVQGIDLSNPAASVAKAKATGARVVRLEADWNALEPTAPGVIDPGELSRLDAGVAAARGAGMGVVLFLDRTPCWASSAPDAVRQGCGPASRSNFEVVRYRPADVTSVVPIATTLAARYAGSLSAFQIWNEPDQANQRYWKQPDGANYVSTYVAMVKALYGPLKQAAPNVPVLAGGFVGTDGAWLKAMYAAGIKGSYDGLAVQFYSDTLGGLRTTKQVQQANGDRTPLWLTEWGFNSCKGREVVGAPTDQPCVTRAAQARGIADVLATVRKRSWIKAAILFDLQDAPRGYQLGLYDQRGVAKPALKVFRRYALGARTAARKPTLRVRSRGGRLVLTGTATTTEPMSLTVTPRGGRPTTVRDAFRADGSNRYSYALPVGYGVRGGLSLRVKGAWTGSSKVVRR